MSDSTPQGAPEEAASTEQVASEPIVEAPAEPTTEEAAPAGAPATEEAPASSDPADTSVPEELTEPFVPEVTADADGSFEVDEPEDTPHGEEL